MLNRTFLILFETPGSIMSFQMENKSDALQVPFFHAEKMLRIIFSSQIRSSFKAIFYHSQMAFFLCHVINEISNKLFFLMKYYRTSRFKLYMSTQLYAINKYTVLFFYSVRREPISIVLDSPY